MGDEVTLITAMFVVLACALAVLLVGRKLRIPLLIGYFVTGIIVGPSTLGLVSEADVSLLAELGVILLMFTIGLEISIKTLVEMKKIVFFGGVLQMALVAGVSWIVLTAFGVAQNVALFIGLMLSLSSTAILMSLYQKSGELNSRHGKVALGILIFQDLAVVPIMLILPFLAGAGGDLIGSAVSLVIGLAFLFAVLFAAIYSVPKLLRHVALTRNSELFIISIVVICFGIAWILSLNGVSLALGAFLAGIAISGSDYSHEVVGQIMPLKNILTGFFFVSVGMMLNLPFLLSYLPVILGLTLAFLVGKFLLNFITAKALGTPTGSAVLAAAGLSQVGEFGFILAAAGVSAGIINAGISQVGEFGFILAAAGVSAGIINAGISQVLLAISIITMALTPILVSVAPKLVARFLPADAEPKEEDAPAIPADHEIIVGYGLAGQYVAKALKRMDIPYIILELNAETVAREKARGENIIFGDASREAVLEYANIHSAKTIILTIPHMDAVKGIITAARRLNPQITIITRSKFIAETSELYHLGADEVIVDERESAIQIFRRILMSKNMPVQDIEQFSREIRTELYDKYIGLPQKLRIPDSDRTTILDSLRLRARRADERLSSEMAKVQQVRVEEGSSVCGKKLCDIHLRANYGVSVLAVRRSGNADAVVSPDGETVLWSGDTVVVIGESRALLQMLPLFICGEKYYCTIPPAEEERGA